MHKDAEHGFPNIQKVLLVGYNGANNTGSEARLISIIEDVRSVLGPEVQITVPTLNEENLRRYLEEDQYLHIAPIPSIFFFAIRKLVKEHDLVLLVEGSCYMDTWTSALLWAFLWTTKCAHDFGKPCVAYAVDAGELSSLNRYLVKREASKTDLIITRTRQATKRLESAGVTAPIKTTADIAFNFHEEQADHDLMKTIWPESPHGVVGLAVVDFSLWPVVIRPWGRKEDLYKWPYYFSRSPKRNEARMRLIEGWSRIADQIILEYGKNIILFCMEELDEPLARAIHEKMKHKDRCRIISSREFNASQMTSLLVQLDLLVTSRYHAAVLSLRSGIPQIAVGHDPRLNSIYQDLGLYEDYFISHCTPNLWKDLDEKIGLLLEDPDLQKVRLEQGYEEQLNLSQQNPILLREFLASKKFSVKP
jgi:polysaccharide pyruvyl transferase WcaK-like protein